LPRLAGVATTVAAKIALARRTRAGAGVAVEPATISAAVEPAAVTTFTATVKSAAVEPAAVATLIEPAAVEPATLWRWRRWRIAAGHRLAVR